MSDKIYVGTGKKTKFEGQVNLTLCLTDLPKEWIYEYKGKKYINLTSSQKKEADQYGKTHYIEVNTYKPDEKKTVSNEPVKPQKDEYASGESEDDLPF